MSTFTSSSSTTTTTTPSSTHDSILQILPTLLQIHDPTLSSPTYTMSSTTDLPLLRPIPRRPFDLDTPSPPTSTTPESSTQIDDPVKRSKSAIALTASTLFGIYSYTDNDAQTPTTISRDPSVLNIADFDFKSPRPPIRPRRATMPSGAAPVHKPTPPHTAIMMGALRLFSLFVFGVAYGVIVTHLHNSKSFTVSPVTIEIDRYSMRYYVQWGLAGVALGSLLPWLDGETPAVEEKGNGKIDWDPAVRSIGAFVGIAYAIRKLPWQSTLQVSLTLALINPFLWYLIDRTRAGFWFSAAVGIAGTAVLLQTNPEMIQAPETVSSGATELVAGLVSVESVGVTTWISSVLFCSCVCFGNVGRRLAWLEKRD